MACAEDSTCPLPDGKEVEILWKTARHLGVSTASGIEGFMASMKATIHEGLEWSPERVSAMSSLGARGGENRTTSQAQVKSSVRTLFDTDPVFRASAKAMLASDPDFADAMTEARKGSCRPNGTCAATTKTARPSVRLYDGGDDETVSLRHDAETGRVLYTRAGVTREAHAERCGPSVSPSSLVAQQCDLAHVLDTVDGVATLGGGKASSSSSDATPVRSLYRVTFGDEDLLVHNSLEARDAQQCASRVCEHNATQCPSSLCKVEVDATSGENSCVPK